MGTALGVLGKDGIHAVSDAVATLVAYGANSIQPSDEGVPAAGGQCVRDRESLLEHAHQRIEVALVLMGDIATKPGRLLAVEDHQLCQSGGFGNCLLVIGNGLLGFGDKRFLLPNDVRPKPTDLSSACTLPGRPRPRTGLFRSHAPDFGKFYPSERRHRSGDHATDLKRKQILLSR